MTAAELVAQIVAGSPGAEEELIARYNRGIEIIIGHGISDRSTVEDIRQDTFAVAIQKIRNGDLHDPERLSGFVCAIARNLAIGYHRRPSRRESGAELPPTLAAGTPTQLDRVLQTEEAALVRSVLEDLNSERDREILRRYYLAEQTKEMICEVLGLSTLHFNRVLFRAKERYRELFLQRSATKGGMIGRSGAPSS